MLLWLTDDQLQESENGGFRDDELNIDHTVGISPPKSLIGAEAEQACLSRPSRGTGPFGRIGLVDTLKVTTCVRRLHVGKVKY